MTIHISMPLREDPALFDDRDKAPSFIISDLVFSFSADAAEHEDRIVAEKASKNTSLAEFAAETEAYALSLEATKTDKAMCLSGVLTNRSSAPLSLDRLRLLLCEIRLSSDDGAPYAFFKNGFQSWTASHVFFPGDSERVPNVKASRVMQENMRNLPSCRKGEFTADGFGVLGHGKVVFLAGQHAPFDQFVYLRATLPQNGSESASIEVHWDFDGKQVPAGASISLDPILLMADVHVNHLMDRYFENLRSSARALGELPTGWCSWYYYYTRINQDEMHENVRVAAEQKINWRYFVLDDGYQNAVGDWLSINKRFPDGLTAIAKASDEQGFIPGIWMAPFYALRRSKLYKEHPDWFLEGDDGRPLWAGWNPLWGLRGHLYALDTTHPGFQDYLRTVIESMVHIHGFKYLKLDFLFAAVQSGKAHDPTLSPAERLKLGLDIIRQAAGEDIVILGCGCPLFPAIGKVDAMRIGPDVAPFWFARYRYHLTRDPHALCTKFAIRSILVRSQMHRMLWLNDPDCLMLRDRKTRLSDSERMTLANAIIITGGMYLISDKLKLLPEAAWSLMRRVDEHTRACDRGRAWTLDIMEHALPGWTWNNAGYLAAFNLDDLSLPRRIRLSDYLDGPPPDGASFEDVWSGERVTIKDGILDLGELPPHASRLLKRIPDHS